jgi:hypothetical protein
MNDTPHLKNACGDGEHEPGWEDEIPICLKCGLSSMTIVDRLGHELRTSDA